VNSDFRVGPWLVQPSLNTISNPLTALPTCRAGTHGSDLWQKLGFL
jgi:hypothetical protein